LNLQVKEQTPFSICLLEEISHTHPSLSFLSFFFSFQKGNFIDAEGKKVLLQVLAINKKVKIQ
jgi:ATP-dependent Clp protease ATP-binding subunit ClpA